MRFKETKIVLPPYYRTAGPGGAGFVSICNCRAYGQFQPAGVCYGFGVQQEL